MVGAKVGTKVLGVCIGARRGIQKEASWRQLESMGTTIVNGEVGALGQGESFICGVIR